MGTKLSNGEAVAKISIVDEAKVVVTDDEFPQEVFGRLEEVRHGDPRKSRVEGDIFEDMKVRVWRWCQVRTYFGVLQKVKMKATIKMMMTTKLAMVAKTTS